MLSKIVEIAAGLLPILKSLLGFFIKTPQEKVDGRKQDARETMEEFKKTGRPKWK